MAYLHHRMPVLWLAIVCLVGMGFAPPAAGMEIVELTYDDPDDTYWGADPQALNDLNQVAGSVMMRTGGGGSIMRAFLWQNGTLLNLGNAIDPTGVDHYSEAHGLNHRGEVVGCAEDGMDQRRSFLWTPSAGMNDLNLPYAESEALCINDAGFVGGFMITDDGSGSEPHQAHGYITHSNLVWEIPTDGGRYSSIEDINARGQAVGHSTDDQWTHLPIFTENSTIHHLQRLPGSDQDWYHSIAHAVNDHGVAVGECDLMAGMPPEIHWHAVLWPDKDSTPIDLGTLGMGLDSEALDVNNRGQVIGMSSMTPVPGSPEFPFIYQNGQMTDLNTLAPDGVTITSVTAINNSGWVLGRAEYAPNDVRCILMKVDPFARAAVGDADLTYEPGGFTEGGYGTVGMAAGAAALSATVVIENPVFGPDGFLTVEVDYDPAECVQLGIDESTIGLYVLQAGVWGLAGRTTNVDQSTGQFVLGPPTDILGDWGVDPDCHYVWANVDHASTYAMAGLPEPATLALLGVGAALLLRRHRR